MHTAVLVERIGHMPMAARALPERDEVDALGVTKRRGSERNGIFEDDFAPAHERPLHKGEGVAPAELHGCGRAEVFVRVENRWAPQQMGVVIRYSDVIVVSGGRRCAPT